MPSCGVRISELRRNRRHMELSENSVARDLAVAPRLSSQNIAEPERFLQLAHGMLARVLYVEFFGGFSEIPFLITLNDCQVHHGLAHVVAHPAMAVFERYGLTRAAVKGIKPVADALPQLHRHLGKSLTDLHVHEADQIEGSRFLLLRLLIRHESPES